MNILWYFLAIGVGFLVCIQSLTNSYWYTQSNIHITILFNGIIVALLSILFFCWGSPISLHTAIKSVKPWIVINGICGFAIITCVALSFARLGAVSALVLILAGQLALGLTFDHFGTLHLPVRSVNLYRLCGIALVIIGAWLIAKN